MLETITKPDKGKSAICTITGDAGVGKTSLACAFPKPIVIRAEDGLKAVQDMPDAFPVLTGVNDLWAQMRSLIEDEHEYQTLVVDSVTALEQMFTDFVITSDTKKPSSINQALGGYGAGLAAVGQLHAKVRKGAGILHEKKGMNIVFVAHADTDTIDPPDSDPYARYVLRLGKRSQRPYVDDVDIVGFLKLETFTRDKKALCDGSRVLVCYSTAANVSKNRYRIDTDLPVKQGENPLMDYITGGSK